jgi:ubiquinone/menaquinone biosynthesis C-methylase UbiE
MQGKKLNFGCGSRFHPAWTNIDFHSESRLVKRVNLLKGFPFPESYFDTVYSSHVLEHFDKRQGAFLVSESYRVLAKGGILRIVVPDLEGSVREYLRVLSMPESPEKTELYSWMIIELLDQLVRSKPTGEMGPYLTNVFQKGSAEEKSYVTSRTQNTPWPTHVHVSLSEKMRRITLARLSTKCLYTYLRLLSHLIPPSIRDVVMVQTGIGERHRWMYDEYSLRALIENAGFSNVRRLSFSESGINNFADFGLDTISKNMPYKNNSIYMEGCK